jgi:hypothetical protein
LVHLAAGEKLWPPARAIVAIACVILKVGANLSNLRANLQFACMSCRAINLRNAGVRRLIAAWQPNETSTANHDESFMKGQAQADYQVHIVRQI